MLENLKALDGRGGDKKKIAPKESWRPQLELDADGGYFVTTPRKAAEIPDQAELLAEFDLNPDEWIVVSVRRSKWQAFDGEWLQAFRVNLLPVNKRHELLDIGSLENEIRKFRPKKEHKGKGELTSIYAVGDTQWGKDAGDGTEATVNRVMGALYESVAHQKTLKNVGTIALPQMGDCIEGVVSQNGKIAGRLDLSLTQQIRVGRRVLLEWVKAFAPLTNDLIIPVVPGNHDESHRQLLTDPMDSWQVEIVQQVIDIAKENPALAHVSARFGERDNSTLTVDMSGTMVGFAHGHQGKGGIENWWRQQALGRTPIGQADVLITAHYHHFKANQVGPNLWVQIPAMDGGSPWFRDNNGLESPPGIVSLVVGEGYDPRRNLTVLAGLSR